MTKGWRLEKGHPENEKVYYKTNNDWIIIIEKA